MWEAAGVTETTKHFHEQFDCLCRKTLTKMLNTYEQKVKESLEINNSERKCRVITSQSRQRTKIEVMMRNHGSPLFHMLVSRGKCLLYYFY